MSIRRATEKEPVTLNPWQTLISFPISSPLLHVERAMQDMSVRSIGMPPKSASSKRPVSPMVRDMERFGKMKRMEAEEAMRKKSDAIRTEQRRIVKKYYKNGKLPPSGVTDEEREWFESSGYGGTLDKAVSDAVLTKYNNDALRIMQRLPPANEANLMPLKHWKMASMATTILETAAQMCDAIVAKFLQNRFDPVSDAVLHTASMKLDIDFDLQSALPGAMAVPPYTIPFLRVQVYARTTPSKARAQLSSRYKVTDPTSAITWSVLFNPQNQQLDLPDRDRRIRDAVNLGLTGPGKRAEPATDDDQVTISTQNGLNAALDGLWIHLLRYPYEAYAHAWGFTVPVMDPVKFRVLPQQAVAPSVPPTQPAPGALPGGWYKKKRDM